MEPRNMHDLRALTRIEPFAAGVHFAMPVRLKLWSLASVAIAASFVICLPACGPKPITDPYAMLADDTQRPARHLAAMELLDTTPGDSQYIKRLHMLIWAPGYTLQVREAALDRLEVIDPDGLQQTIREQLPPLTAMLWRERLCEIIAERGWVNQTHTLIRGWARRREPTLDQTQWPEYKALAALHPDKQVVDVLFETFVEARSVVQQGLRTLCWELLHIVGERDRLRTLLASAQVGEGDAMLLDLRAAATDLGVIPHTREEILWLRTLCKPEYESFWQAATTALQEMPADQRLDLEMRDISIAVAVHQYRRQLLRLSRNALYDKVEQRLDGIRRYTRAGSDSYSTSGRDRLMTWRDELTWGDLAAITMALEAVAVPQVASHLFDYADRDRADVSTEYGGLIDLDDLGRFQVLEFIPRMRQHDEKFIASQAMFDASYTAMFHFHYHAQKRRNEKHAGPGMGDRQYADAVRSNCLVLTFVREDRLNVDFYRHGGVLVDLGSIDRGAGET